MDDNRKTITKILEDKPERKDCVLGVRLQDHTVGFNAAGPDDGVILIQTHGFSLIECGLDGVEITVLPEVAEKLAAQLLEAVKLMREHTYAA